MSDCCKWERVMCNSTTGHVTELSLNNTRQYDIESMSFYEDENIWFAKFSMFQQLKELRSLNLSYNKIGGFIDGTGFETLSELKKLEVLDLSTNYFNNSILSPLSNLTSLKTLILGDNIMEGSFPSKGFERLEELDISYNGFNNSMLSSLGALTSLKTLILRGNNMKGFFPIQELSKLKNLKSLDVSGNRFNSTLPFQELSTFKSLEILNLMGNEFTGSIPEYMWTPPSLKVLFLSDNKLNGFLPNQSLCGLKGLQELDLSYNEFGGSLPQCLDNLTSLMFLDLSGNQLTGHIPSSWPANLKFIDLSYNRFEGISSFKNIPSSSPANFKSSLEYIDLSSNLFEGLFSFNLLANYSSVEVVILSGNNITFETGWIPSFQLKVLIMQSCGLDSIPEFLFYQFKLEALDLSHNKVKGRFPNWLLENNGGLEMLNLQNNSFKGQLQEIGTKMLPNMRYLNLAINYFQGKIPDMKGQFSTFESNSYEGNPFLCGPQVERKCNDNNVEPPSSQVESRHEAPNEQYNVVVGSRPCCCFAGRFGSRYREDLYFLEVFSVAHNNLSGRIPDMKGQFSTFESNSYEGNPFLCGPQVERKCNDRNVESPSSQMESTHEVKGKWYEIDHGVFLSFSRVESLIDVISSQIF
ncbi:hypothetical protein GH714_013502 [Hevea brasiliensis]|uniref:Leucine-rich repeat-containing N-terminal plant-type domain-containing protein n=1 Tax=Hevea brasiliensis TaxID=3981 RepID=A0A6A6LXH5_HEVBR|nr:hypothetical protein GH714_013502 [Hevea brasiliensis]